MIDEFKEKNFCVRKRFKQNFKVFILFKLWGQIILMHIDGKVLLFFNPTTYMELCLKPSVNYLSQ